MAKSLIVALFVACLIASAMALTMKIEPKSEECFSETLNVGDDVEVRWGVQDGGLLDIEARVCQFSNSRLIQDNSAILWIAGY